MEEITSLSIIGYNNHPLSNTYFRHSEPSNRLALFFPGRGYTCAMPLLYYPTRLLVEKGADALWVEYNYTRTPGFDALSSHEQLQWISGDSSAAVMMALSEGHYSEVILVGKSLGSLALSHLILNEPALRDAAVVWLTPLLRNTFVQKSIAQAKPRSLFILGSADPLYDAQGLDEARRATNGAVLLVPQANHSLEIPGDLPATLQAMGQALDAIAKFSGW
jgi:hypothetical protein